MQSQKSFQDVTKCKQTTRYNVSFAANTVAHYQAGTISYDPYNIVRRGTTVEPHVGFEDEQLNQHNQ